MSDSYTKLTRSLATSTICEEALATRWLWVVMLSQCDRRGHVFGSIPGLARLANITVIECETALERFQSPDHYSRTKDDEGRRVRLIDGGWELINHAKYSGTREPDMRDRAEYMRGYRAKNSAPASTSDVTSVTTNVTSVTTCNHELPEVTESSAPSTSTSTSTSNKENALVETFVSTPKQDAPKIPYSEIVAIYHAELPLLAGIRELSEKRKLRIKKIWASDEAHQSLDFWKWYFSGIAKIPFCCGANERGWRADIDYLLRDDVFLRRTEELQSMGHELEDLQVVADTGARHED